MLHCVPLRMISPVRIITRSCRLGQQTPRTKLETSWLASTPVLLWKRSRLRPRYSSGWPAGYSGKHGPLYLQCIVPAVRHSKCRYHFIIRWGNELLVYWQVNPGLRHRQTVGTHGCVRNAELESDHIVGIKVLWWQHLNLSEPSSSLWREQRIIRPQVAPLQVQGMLCP